MKEPPPLDCGGDGIEFVDDLCAGGMVHLDDADEGAEGFGEDAGMPAPPSPPPPPPPTPMGSYTFGGSSGSAPVPLPFVPVPAAPVEAMLPSKLQYSLPDFPAAKLVWYRGATDSKRLAIKWSSTSTAHVAEQVRKCMIIHNQQPL